MKRFKSYLSKCWIEIVFYFLILFKVTVFCTMLKSNSGMELNLRNVIGLIDYRGIYLLFPLILISIALLFKTKGKITYLYLLDLFLTIFLICDVMYYRSYGTFLSVKFLMYPELFNPFNKKLLWFDSSMILMILDLILIPFIFVKIKKYTGTAYIKKLRNRIIAFLLTFIIPTTIIVVKHYRYDIKDITNGQKGFMRVLWTPTSGIFQMTPLGYHAFDIYRTFSMDKDIDLTSQQQKEIEQWLKDNKENLPDNKYKGQLKGKNLMVIQVESLEDFVIGKSIEGQSITPNIDDMLKNSYYFPNIYEQNLIGFSSDADLMVNTGLLPVTTAATSFTYPCRKVETLPSILEKNGYETASAHPEVAGSWNWGEVHKGLLKFDKSFDIYSFNEDEIIGLGLSDKSYLSQLADKMAKLKQPFYGFTVTLTNHGPFDIDDKNKSLKIPKVIENTKIGNYFQTVRYTDEAIKIFLDKLSKDGLLDNTVVVIYGDHAGPTKYYKDELAGISYDGDWWKPEDKKVPLIIYNPSIKGEKFETAGGLTDVMPTVLYLLGINENGDMIGRNLLNTNRNAVAVPEGIKGIVKSPEEEQHLKKAYEISTNIIRSDYFKRYKN